MAAFPFNGRCVSHDLPAVTTDAVVVNTGAAVVITEVNTGGADRQREHAGSAKPVRS